jgi:methyl-accepting chemotaxis protein
LCAWVVFFSPSAAFSQETRESFALDAAVGLQAYQGMVEEHLAGVLNGLKTLAATEVAASGSWQRLRGPLAEFAKDSPDQAAIWFAKSDGSYFTIEKGLVGETLSDRDYFPALLGGKTVEGSLVVSKSTGERSIIVAAPIVRNGKVIGALGASLSATKLAKRVSDQIAFPDNVIFYVLDSHGQTALHHDSSLIFEFPSDIGDETLKSAVQQMLSKPEGAVQYTFRGTPRTVIFRRSKATGWVFVLGATHAN